MQLTWNPWVSVSQGKSAAGGQVTALPYKNLLALFITDPNGGVYSALGSPVAGWGAWSSVAQGQTAPKGIVSAISYRGGFALFVADSGGGIYTIAGAPDTGWGAWSNISQGRAAPGAPVSVLPLGERIAVFIADPNGGVYTTAGTPNGGWGPWASVSQGQTVAGSLVTAVTASGQPASIQLFITDPNGGIYTASGNPDTGFGPWSEVGSQLIAPGSPITAIPLGTEFALLFTDASGRVMWTTGNTKQGWRPWINLSQGSGVKHSIITAVPTPWLGNGNTWTVLVSDPNGGTYASVGDIYEAHLGWGPWASVSNGHTLPGATVTPAVVPGNHLVALIANPNGEVYATSSRFVAPLAPTGLRQTAVASTSIAIAWTDTANDADGFHIDFTGTIANGPNSSGEISVGSSARAATLNNLVGGYTYTIKVTAFNAAGNSPSSAPIVVTTPSSPASVQAAAEPVTSVGTQVWGLVINGSNFQSGETVQLVITWTLGDTGTYAYTVSALGGNLGAGTFTFTFLGNTPYGLCAGNVPDTGEQTFQVQATGLTSNKKATTTARFSCA